MNNLIPETINNLGILADRPPQTMLLEGGSEKSRLDHALYWAMLNNCPNAAINSEGVLSPCLKCNTCHQILAYEFFDLLIYDGRISNTEDEDKPQLIKAMSKDNMDKLKQILGNSPKGGKNRIIIFLGIIKTREEAMNSLLKLLEEPPDSTLFIMLTPQRGQILQTLVSRAFCLSLPWIYNEENEDLIIWEKEIGEFLLTGKGLFDKFSSKGALTPELVYSLISLCQRALINAQENKTKTSLSKFFVKIINIPQKLYQANQWLMESQEMLSATVNPARIMEGLITNLYILGKN